MLRKGSFLLLSLLTALTSGASMATAAATGDGAVRVATASDYYGIQGTLTIPSDVFVADHPTDPTKKGYIAFYLGLGEKCEGGISYTPTVGWKKFLNCGPNSEDGTRISNMSVPLTTQPSPGTTYSIKLVNNLNNTASLYINGALAYTLQVSPDRTLTAPTHVKMVHSTHDPQDKNRYTNASYSNVLVKESNGSYSAFPSSIESNIYPWGKGDYSVPSLNPLQSSLIAAP